jgi:PAS domain S-box-containing protein
MLQAYFLGSPVLYGSGLIPPALPTALSFTFLALAISLNSGMQLLTKKRDFSIVLAFLLPVLAFALQKLFWPFIDHMLWFFFYPAVFFSAWLAGLRGAIFSTLLSVPLVVYFFIPPFNSFALENYKSILSIILFSIMGILFGFIQERLLWQKKRADNALSAFREINEKLEQRVRERTAELAQINKAVRASEQRFRTMADNAPVLIWISGPDRKYTWFNRQWLDFAGCSLQEELAKSWAENVHPDDYRSAINTYIKHFDDRLPFRMEYRVNHYSGEWRWVINSGVPYFASDGEFLGYVGSCIDITERKKAEDRFRLAITSAPNGILMADENGIITLVNTQIESYFGYKSKELLGQPVEKLLPQSLRGKHPSLRKSYMHKPTARPMGAGRDLFAVRKDGSGFPVEIGLNPIQTDSGMEILAVIVDITERNRSIEAIRSSEKRYHHTLDSMMEGCQIIGKDWRYIYINEAAEKHNRRPKEELLGNKYKDMWPGIEKTLVYRYIKQTMKQKINNRIETEFVFPDGTSGWFEVSVHSIPEGVFILSQDITDRKTAEQKVVKLNEELEEKVKKRTAQLETANNELESFSYSVSHDLRAPLRAISGFSQKLQRNYQQHFDEEAQRLVRVIVNNTNKMGQLIDDLLTFSRLGKKEKSVTLLDMEKLVQNVLKDMNHTQEHKKVKITIKKLPAAYGDRAMLTQVYHNLIANALKFSSKKSNPQVEIGFKKKGKEIIYFVKDNGAGFNMQFIDKLFGVFQRLHTENEFEGTGIGLSLVKRIIQKHGGRIWAEAAENKGATFSFTLTEKETLNAIS